MYTDKVMDHFEHPRNVGELENPSGMGTVGNPKCGDIMRIYPVSYTHQDVYKRQSKDLYEAASIDGATGFKKFRYITIPMLKPTTFFVIIMMTIQCFKVFDLIYVMTGGGPGPVSYTHLIRSLHGGI